MSATVTHNKSCNCDACQIRREEDFAELEVRTIAIAAAGGSEELGIPPLAEIDAELARRSSTCDEPDPAPTAEERERAFEEYDAWMDYLRKD